MVKRLVFVFLIVLIVLLPASYILGPDLLKRKIKKEIFSRFQIEMNYDKIKVLSLDPLKIHITAFSAKKINEIDLSIKSISAELNLKEILINWRHKRVRAKLELDAVTTIYKLSLSAKSNTPTAQMTTIDTSFGKLDLKDYLKSNFAINDLSLLIKITKFDYNLNMADKSFRIYGTDSGFKIRDLETPIEFGFNAFLYSKKDFGLMNGIYIPIKYQFQFSVRHGVLSVFKSDLSIADISNSFKAQVDLNNLNFDSSAKIKIAKIESIDFFKRYQQQLPFSNPTGEIGLEVFAKGNIHSLPMIQAKGVFSLKYFSTQLKIKTADLSALGPIRADVTSSFTYINKTPAITSANWTTNLDGCEITYKDLFHKNNSIRLASEGTISYHSDLNIEKFKLWFHKMDISIQGMASLLRASDLLISVKPFKLQDFKSFLPSNKNFDLSGDVEIDAQVKGFLTQPKYLTVNVRKILANNLKYYLKYKTKNFSIEGPVSLTLAGNLLIERSQAVNGSITGNSDLSLLILEQNNQMIKTNSDPFNITWAAQAKEGKLNIQKLNFNTFLARFSLNGQPPLSFEDSLNLTMTLDSLNWKKVKKLLPVNEWLNTISDMTNKGTLTVKGKLDPRQLLNSKLSLDSNIETAIDTVSLPFNFHLSKPTPAPTQVEPVLTTPSAFIKDASLLKTVRWNQKVSIRSVSFKDSGKFQNIQFNANLENNSLKMSGQVHSIFNGSLGFTDVLIPLTEADPKILYNLKSSNISFSPLIDFVFPEYKDLLSGVANFEVTGHSKIPGTLNFKKDLIANGKFFVPVSELHTLKLLEEVKQKFSTIQGVSVPNSVSISNLGASTQSTFEIKDSVIQLTDFKAIVRNKDEIDLNGRVQFDLDSKINGTLRLANGVGQGDFLLANQNKSGQIEIPIYIEGNLKKPKWNFVGNTLQKMSQNFIDYQKNKAKALVDRKVAEFKNQAHAEAVKQKKAAEKILENKKNSLENEAKKKLGELFK